MTATSYFPNLAIQHLEEDDDRSYPSSKQQLCWLLEDSQNRLDELMKQGVECRGWDRLIDNDIRYAIPDCLNYIADAERAIELATQDLKIKYDIDICDDTQSDVSDEDPQAIKLHVGPLSCRYSFAIGCKY